MLWFDGRPVAPWIYWRLRYARRHGWTGRLLSGWRSARQQQLAAEGWAMRVGIPVERLYPGGVQASAHRGLRFPRGAVDVSDPGGMLRAMRAWSQEGKPRPLVGGGTVLRNDPEHFSANGR